MRHFTSTQLPRSFPSRRWILSPNSCSYHQLFKESYWAKLVKPPVLSISACRESACENKPSLLIARGKHIQWSFFRFPKWSQTPSLRHQIPITDSLTVFPSVHPIRWGMKWVGGQSIQVTKDPAKLKGILKTH